MSAAGFERVNVTQRKLPQRPGGELAVVDDHDQRERPDRVVGPNDRQNAAIVGLVDARNGGPSTARTPGRATRGSRKPSGRRRPAGSSVGSVAPPRAGGGDHDLRALVQAVARVVERVDRRPGLEMEVVRPVDPLEHVAEEARRRRGCRGRGRPPAATISRYFASDICPWPRIALAWSAAPAAGGRRHRGRTARCRSPAAAGGRRRRRRRGRRGRRGSPSG